VIPIITAPAWSGFDKDTDLAVIKIEADHDLPVAKLGNSDGVQVGDWVLAFGSPFGLNSTVTAGIVSAKDRLEMSAISSSVLFKPMLRSTLAIPGAAPGQPHRRGHRH